MHTHFTEYTFGDIVFLRTDVNQEQWIVTDIFLHPNNVCVYTIACGSSKHDAYDFELSRDQNTDKKLGL